MIPLLESKSWLPSLLGWLLLELLAKLERRHEWVLQVEDGPVRESSEIVNRKHRRSRK